MTNAPKSRKTHVIRILGTNKKKEILRDIWADVERIDTSRSRDKGTPGFRQGLVRKFRWRDDPANTEEYLDPDLEDVMPELYKRKTVLVKVCKPDEQNLNDPEEWIPIRAIKRIRSKRNSQQNNADQQQYEKLINSDIQQSRTVEQRRIPHYDTNIDGKAEKAFDDNPELKAYVVTGKEYVKLDGSPAAAEFADPDNKNTKDEDQYVEHEIATKLHHRGNSVYNGSGNEPNDSGPNGRQKRVTRMRNQYLIDESEPAKLEELGLNDINPPYRLDPFQNIVNVKLKTIYLFVSLSGSNGSFSFGPYGPAPKVTKSPSVEAIKNINKSGIRLLDTFKPSGSNNNGLGSGFLHCFPYPIGGDLVTSWIIVQGGGGRIVPVHGVCPVVNPNDPSATTAPINFEAFAAVTTFYLFSITVGDDIVDLNIKGIIEPFDSGLNTNTYSRTTKDGSVAIDLRVYSRVKNKIWKDPTQKKISDLINYLGDEKPRPTEDDAYTLNVTNSNQGKFQINVKLDKDKAHAQIDNYGKSFQPYKVTLTPNVGTDHIPSQPPLRLPD